MQTLTTTPIARYMQVKGNFFSFSPTKPFYKYKCKISPLEKQEDVTRLFYRLARCLGAQIRKIHGPHLALNSIIYSSVEDKPGIFEFTLDDQKYKFEMEYSGQLTDENSAEKFQFLGRMLKKMQDALQMVSIQRKYFNANFYFQTEQGEIEIYPGYQSALRSFGLQKIIFANIDVAFKMSRREAMDHILSDLQKRYSVQEISSMMKGRIVMTNYEPVRMYRIDSINYEMNPKCHFTQKTNLDQTQEVSYIQYYSKRYNQIIQNMNQPLIVNKDRKTGKEIYLVPELCKLTGLEESQRSNFNLMKQVDSYTKLGANQRLIKTKELISQINECQKIDTRRQDEKEQQKKLNKEPGEIIVELTQQQKEEKEWKKKQIEFLRGVQLNEEPEVFNSKLLKTGELFISPEQSVKIGEYDWEKRMQKGLFQRVNPNRWAIFTLGHNNFIGALNDSQSKWANPKVFEIKSNQYRDWVASMTDLSQQNCQGVVLILPGQKKQAPLYNDLKRYLIQEQGIPSQVVIEGTLKGGKSIRSICNKILAQFCAKLGGLPWVFNDMPFTQVPTMIVGIDVYHKTFGGIRKSIFAFVATVDRYFAKYFSMVKLQEPGQEIGTYVEDCCVKAFQDFFNISKKYPQRIIVFRDGVSQSQRAAVKALEVEAFRRACTTVKSNSQLIFICVDKRTNAKFYEQTTPTSVQNCPPGTIIDDPRLCTYEEFYMISQKTNQGIASPTHYYVLVDDLALESKNEQEKANHKQNLEVLAYKLCYMYFNWTGSIKVPAPCIYAHKLSNLVGDKWPLQDFHPHENLCKQKSLYFI